MSGTPKGGNATPPTQGGADPSMEDILASIRRILSEDEAAAAPAPPPPPPKPAEPEVLALDTSMLVEPPKQAPEASPEPPAVDPSISIPPPPPPQAAAPAPAPAADSGRNTGLVAPAAAAAAASSVGALVRTLAEHQALAVHRGGPTIEDVVREEIRPLLKAWLDENLPPLVERLVRAEIERVVGRAVT